MCGIIHKWCDKYEEVKLISNLKFTPEYIVENYTIFRCALCKNKDIDIKSGTFNNKKKIIEKINEFREHYESCIKVNKITCLDE